jgi:hypothetical protein
MPTAESVYRGYSRNRLQTSVATGTRIATEAANGFIESLPISSAISSKLLPIPYCVGYQWISPAHCTRHFPVQNVARATYRDILERRAKENRVDFIEGVATAITSIAFFETVMVKSYETLFDSETTADVNTGMVPASRLQAVIGSNDYSREIAEMRVQVGMIAQAVRSVVPESMWAAIIEKLEQLLQQHSAALDVGTDDFDDDDPL